jgi:tetratricopeptide (TPR) repeat protein
MMFLVNPLGWVLVLICLGASGCFPSGRSPLEEQKEPHYLTGKARVNSLDYKGAIEAFEKALEANPRSASAHFELALLYERDETDFAAAIYHFEQYLRLQPKPDNAEIVRQRVIACKQELAKTVSLGPVTQTMQRDLERLTAENRELRRQLEAWQAYYASHPQPGSNLPPAAAAQPGTISAPGSARQSSVIADPAGQPTAIRQPTASTAKTHTVKAGESPYSIAKKYGVKLNSLLAANPHADPKRLRVGQTLTIPAP